MTDSSKTLGRSAALAPIVFAFAAPLTLFGLLGVLGVFPVTGLWLVLAWVALGLAVLLNAATVAIVVGASRWDRLRKGTWTRLAVRVQPDIADQEVLKTVLQTEDGEYRILLLRYPLELRDRVHTDEAVEYVGDLGHDAELLIRPVGGGQESERFGRAKSMVRLQAERG